MASGRDAFRRREARGIREPGQQPSIRKIRVYGGSPCSGRGGRPSGLP